MSRKRLVTELIAGPVKLGLWLAVRDRVLIDGDQYELVLSVDGLVLDTEVIIGRHAALARFQEKSPQVATLVARLALGLGTRNV